MVRASHGLAGRNEVLLSSLVTEGKRPGSPGDMGSLLNAGSKVPTLLLWVGRAGEGCVGRVL